MTEFTVAKDCPVCYKRNTTYLKTMRRKSVDEIFFCGRCSSKLTEEQIDEMWKEINK